MLEDRGGCSIRFVGTSDVLESLTAIASPTSPSGARGTIGWTTTMRAQQQRQPSPEQSSPESCVAWDENRHSGDAIAAQAKISAPASLVQKFKPPRRTATGNSRPKALLMPAGSSALFPFYLRNAKV